MNGTNEDAHGWIRWEGGECAFKRGRIQLLYKDGDMSEYPFTAEYLADSWHVHTQIYYYRLHRDDQLLPINAGAQHGGQESETTASPEAPAGEHAAAPAPECEHKHFYENDGRDICERCWLSREQIHDQRKSAVQVPDATSRTDAEQSDSHLIRRNRYGLRDKYPSPPVSRLVGFCHPGMFKEWKR